MIDIKMNEIRKHKGRARKYMIVAGLCGLCFLAGKTIADDVVERLHNYTLQPKKTYKIDYGTEYGRSSYGGGTVPEPSTFVLIGAGGGLVALLENNRRSRRK